MKAKFQIKDSLRIILLLVMALLLIGLFLGVGLNSKNFSYALSRRIPKIYAIILTGGAIGFSSLIFQTVTNNHILTPSILGLDSLYMLVNTTIVFVLGSSSRLITNRNTNFIVTIVVMLMVSAVFYKVILKKGSQNIFFLLLLGIIVGTMFDSFASFMQILIDPVQFQVIQDKMQASFNNINTEVLVLTTIVIVVAMLYSLRFVKILDVMALGRDQAINLGVDYDAVVKRMLVVVVLLTGVSTALVGPITFLGLLVVNIGRHMVKSYKHSILTITILLISIVALVGGQLIVERVLNYGMSVGIIINFVGGIYFIYLIMKGRTQ